MTNENSNPPSPMETPGFGSRVTLSIVVVFGWLIFLILWLLLAAQNYDIIQNITAILVSLLVAILILAVTWASWGIQYGWKFKNAWREKNPNAYADCGKPHWGWNHGGSSAVYGLGFLGALVYYVTTAPTFWEIIIGIFKAILWPAFLIYSALRVLG